MSKQSLAVARERALDKFIAALVSPLGLQQSDALIYLRPLKEAVVAVLAFPIRTDSHGISFFTCNIGLRFETLERWLRETSTPNAPSIVMPIHLLREQPRFTEWQFAEAADLDALRESIEMDLRQIALPFIEQYSDLAQLRRRLQLPDPREWFVLTSEQRICMLAAIQRAEGDKSLAIRTLDDALAERVSAPPKKRVMIEAMRQRLTEAG